MMNTSYRPVRLSQIRLPAVPIRAQDMAIPCPRNDRLPIVPHFRRRCGLPKTHRILFSVPLRSLPRPIFLRERQTSEPEP